MKHLKKVLSVLLMVLLMAGVIPAMTAAAADTHANQVHVVVENNTYAKAKGASWEGKLVDEWVTIDDSSTMMSCVSAAVKKDKYTISGADSGYISDINGLAAGASTSVSGWMGTLNDWITSEGFSAYTVANKKLSAGDTIDIAYSQDMGADIGGSWSNNNKTLKSIETDAGTLKPAFSSTTANYTLKIPDGTTAVTVTPTASNKNFQVHTYLGTQETGKEYKRSEAIPVSVGSVITVVDGDPSWPTMNDAASVAKQTYTITVAPQNQKPVLAEGVSASVSQKVESKGTYTQDLSKIFTDADGDTLTYSVSVNGAAAVAADANYSYAFDLSKRAQATLVFTASDSKLNSDTYTVDLVRGTNTAPALKDGVGSTETLEYVWISEGTSSYKYFDPADYFTDADGDNLTYTVACDGKEATAITDSQTVIVSNSTQGIHSYVFQANDGQANSPTHTLAVIIRQGGKPVITAGAGASIYRQDDNHYEYILGSATNDQIQLKATVVPATTSQHVTWKVNNGKLASIDSNGLLTLNSAKLKAKKNYVEVTAASDDGGESYVSLDIIPTGIDLGAQSIDVPLAQDGSVKTTTQKMANNYFNGEVTVTSSDEQIVTAAAKNQDIIFTPVKPGKATVTVAYTLDPSIKATIAVNVTGVLVQTKETGASTRLLLSKDATAPTLALKAVGASSDETFTWSSSDESVATVDDKGVVTGHKVGPVAITAKSSASTVLNEVKGAINLDVGGQGVPYLKDLSFLSFNFFDGWTSADSNFKPTITDYDIKITNANLATLYFTPTFDSDLYDAKVYYKDTTGNETNTGLTSGSQMVLNAMLVPGDNTVKIALSDKKDAANTTTYTIRLKRPYSTYNTLSRLTVYPGGKTAESYPLYKKNPEGTLFQLKDGQIGTNTGFNASTMDYKAFVFSNTTAVTLNTTFTNTYEHARLLTDGKDAEILTSGVDSVSKTLDAGGTTVFTFQVVSSQTWADDAAAGIDPWSNPEMVYTVTVEKVKADAEDMKITSARIVDADTRKEMNYFAPGFSPTDFAPKALIDYDTKAVDMTFTVPAGYKVYKGSVATANEVAAKSTGDKENTYQITVQTHRVINTASVLLYDEASGQTYTYRFSLVQKGQTGVEPDAVVEYLCLGSQYTNRSNYGMVPEMTIAYGGGTKSLGNFGGHIVYKYNTPITNDPKNPNGIDFIVSGNAFADSQSASEPGCVQVSKDGKTWYTLAGSAHYDDECDWNYTMTYTKTSAGTSSWTASDGTSGTNYQYPLAENYPLFSWDEGNQKTMTVSGEHLVANAKDPYGSASAAYPDFGYVDTHASGAKGKASNPYLGSGQTKDGQFDLAWAVDDQGNPVSLDSISYIKVATASNIYAGWIGEKSTEVTSVYTTQNKETADVGTTDAPASITVDGTPVALVSGTNTYTAVADGDFNVTVSAGADANVYINGARGTSRDYAVMPTHKMLRVIVQEGEKAPYIATITLKTPDEASLEQVKALIDALPAKKNLALTDEAQVQAARTAYDALKDAVKAQVPAGTLAKLTEDETQLAKLKADKAAADAVSRKIDALPEAAELTLGYQTPVKDARKAYDALTGDQQALVDKALLAKLQADEAKIAKLTEHPEVTSFKGDPATTQNIGKPVTLTATAEKGTEPYTYKVTYKTGTITGTIKEFDEKNSVQWTPAAAGDYTLTVMVKDANGNTGEQTMAYTVKDPAEEEVQSVIAQMKAAEETIKANKGGAQDAYDAAQTAFEKMNDSQKAEAAAEKSAMDKAMDTTMSKNHHKTLGDKSFSAVKADGSPLSADIELIITEAADAGGSAQRAQDANSGKQPVMTFNAKLVNRADGSEIMNPGSITITVSADLTGYETGDVVVCHIKSSGTLENLKGTYDADAKTITFTVSSFSDFVVMASKAGVPGTTPAAAAGSTAAAGAATAGSNAATGIDGTASLMTVLGGAALAILAALGAVTCRNRKKKED